ncbi:hypothetical protein HK099_007329 [Clydaea vesicula]|uniref:Thioredoxin domain-containing protein n=1 Tax=Clydaea vesicula TaxID=447962 RepID=A0AAD5U5L9_9FUNG|nr:hypothetical protein HK099_007329 [Clydaea vesicula]
MAKVLSKQLTGMQINGIWHTSVVCFGKEVFFGQGIQQCPPGRSGHGQPIEIIDMGETELTTDVYNDFLNEINGFWSADKYHLLDNNCNTFSNEVCNFLVGKNIPDYIVGLPAEVMNTPFGAAIRPMIEGMFGPSSHPQLNLNGFQLTPTTSANTLEPTAISGKIYSVKSLTEFQNLLKTHKCVAVDFTSNNCPPCRVISPYFEELVMEKSKLVGVSVEVPVSREISTFYNITATPTFKFFLNGELLLEFKGANRQELKSAIDFLIYSGYPPHPHSLINTSVLDSFFSPSCSPIKFKNFSNLDQIFLKIAELLNRSETLKQEKLNFDILKKKLKQQFELNQDVFFKNESNFKQFDDSFQKVLIFFVQNNQLNDIFPFVDVIRLLMLNKDIQEFYMTERVPFPILLINEVINFEQRGKALMLMTNRLACNLFYSEQSIKHILFSENRNVDNTKTSFKSIVTSLLIESLLSKEKIVREAASSLSFNFCFSFFKYFSEEEKKNFEMEEVKTELICCFIKSFEEKFEKESFERLLVSLGILIKFCEKEVLELISELGLKELLGKVDMVLLSEVRVQKLINEVKQLL